ncbi:DUF1492 domain-containing protein [Anaerovoracaceae bacterium 42-11]
MEAKQFLEQYQNILTDIRNLEAQKLELENLAMGVTVSADGERVQSSGRKDRMAELAVKIADAEREIIEQRTQAFYKLREIEEAIKAVPDGRQQQILHMRYVERKKWEEIAVDLGIDYRWTLRLHGKALKKIEDFIN